MPRDFTDVKAPASEAPDALRQRQQTQTAPTTGDARGAGSGLGRAEASKAAARRAAPCQHQPRA